MPYNICLFTHQKVAKFVHDGEPFRLPFGWLKVLSYIEGLKAPGQLYNSAEMPLSMS
jgi:hypothetical protein